MSENKINADRPTITVLCPNKIRRGGLMLFYSLFPLLRKRSVSSQFHFTNSIDFCLKKDPNKHILIVRFLENDYKFNDINTTDVLNQLRQKYKRIALFDDGDRASIDFPHALAIVDLYFHSQIYKNRKYYTEPIHRGQLYSDFFFNKGIKNSNDFFSVPVNKNHLKKLNVAWNIGAGSYPRIDWLRRAGLVAAGLTTPSTASFFYKDPSNSTIPTNEEIFDVQARFSIQNEPTIAEQRKLVLEKLSEKKSVLTGMTSQKQFKKEIKNSKIVISPFGWGEVCFRDFEAILNGALLLKPSMDHLETWPDVYKSNHTYISFRWDAEDLNEKIDMILADDEKRREIAKNAFKLYMESLNELDQRVEQMIELIIGY